MKLWYPPEKFSGKSVSLVLTVMYTPSTRLKKKKEKLTQIDLRVTTTACAPTVYQMLRTLVGLMPIPIEGPDLILMKNHRIQIIQYNHVDLYSFNVKHNVLIHHLFRKSKGAPPPLYETCQLHNMHWSRSV